MFDWLGYTPLKYDDGTEFQTWAQALGWCCTLVVVVAIFIAPIYHFIRIMLNHNGTFAEVCCTLVFLSGVILNPVRLRILET